MNKPELSSVTRVTLGFAISVHFFKSGFLDIFHAKSGFYPDFSVQVRIGPYIPFSNCK